MGYRAAALCISMLLGAAAPNAAAETVVLKGGYRVIGDLLKQDEKAVVVDLGCAVVRLPRSEVVQIVKDKPAETRTTARATRQAGIAAVERKAAEWQLYRTAELRPRTIEQNAELYSEGVVMVTTPNGQGSGFVVNPEGYMITNYHVIANETRIKVTVFRKTEQGFEQKHFKKVRIIAINPFVDLALLKIEEAEKPFKYVYLGSMEQIEAGQPCFAIGNPLGLTRTVSQGIVSTKNRNFEGRLYIQTTTDLNPGNSGGPLFNLKGEVIGVTSMGYLFLGGLNFAIPVDVVRRFVENRDAFAYDEDNPNAGHRYLQPAGRKTPSAPPKGRLPALEGEPKTGDSPAAEAAAAEGAASK
jgi:serine protease Do